MYVYVKSYVYVNTFSQIVLAVQYSIDYRQTAGTVYVGTLYLLSF